MLFTAVICYVSFILCLYGKILTPQFLYAVQNLLLPFLRGSFEPVDITAKQGGIESELFGETGNIDLRMRQEKVLKARGFRISVQETLETDILVKLPPMNSYRADLVPGALFVSRIPEMSVPQQGLAVRLPVISQSVEPISFKPYFTDCLHYLP